ncbi:MAG: response regulator [Firmicutes bacterium]|nr:response regulator [Bacillota bacterium]
MKKVYIAEDDKPLSELMKAVLQKFSGCEFEFFYNGLDLYRRVQDSPPDLLILDIILPKLDGLSIAKLIKFSDDYKNIHILVVSSMISPDIQERVKKAGADNYMKKPFNLSEFRNLVSGILNG